MAVGRRVIQTMQKMLVLVFACGLLWGRVPSRFEATAYAIEGTTANGGETYRGTVAADPALLPLGTRIRVTHAGRYSGMYTVKDTGRNIQGARLDFYMPSRVEAKRFGKRVVRVRVVRMGTR